MKIVAISDIHGNLPEIPDCDLLLIGGDIVPTWAHSPKHSVLWMESKLKYWVNSLAERMKVVACAGNHDFVFEKMRLSDLPQMNWTYLQDTGTEFQGLKIWGSPWQPTFHNWAFNLNEPELVEKWALIPEDTDILLLHGPPYGYGDFSPYDKIHTGSPGLTEVIERIKPKLAVAGHIHSGAGKYNIGETIFINASYVDEQYKPKNMPFEVEI